MPKDKKNIRFNRIQHGGINSQYTGFKDWHKNRNKGS